MELYDNAIYQMKQLLKQYPVKRIPKYEGRLPLLEGEQVLLRRDMAYELGGGTLPAISMLAFTTSKELVSDSASFLCGQDITALQETVPYARVALIRLSDEFLGQDIYEQGIYDVLRRIDFVRYRLRIDGYMMRISAAKEREVVRIGAKAREEGLTFSAVGQCFMQSYLTEPEVKEVQTYFITLPEFDYEALRSIARKTEGITESLNYIYEAISMDCDSCGLRAVCDEVEGLKELHFNRGSR
ncbi:MAG: hypothetical protein J6D02_05600 [Lachnospira sp.]|nr:hypothetical protein [Lachnospira sp.]